MSLKEVVEKICEPNPRRLIKEDEIAFGAPIAGGGIVAICPFCQQVVRIRESDLEQPVNRASESIALKKPVSCRCRGRLTGVRYDYLDRYESVYSGRRACLMFAAAGLCGVMLLAFYSYLQSEEPILIIGLLLFGLSIIGIGGLCALTIYMIYVGIKALPSETPTEKKKCELRIKAEQRARAFEQKDEELEKKNIYAHKKKHGEVSVVSGYAIGKSWDNDSPDSYVPDDFEPGLDPYDREALYDEEVIDDLVLSGGGDPFDFEDRMDALSDPFGFGGDGDGDSWD